MGERQKAPLRVGFERGIKLEFHGAKITSDAGLLVYRELDDAFYLTTSTANQLVDVRTGMNTQHSMTALLRQSIYSRLGGYEDLNDAERLRVDPAMRQVVGGRARETTAASTSEVGRFETEILSQPANLEKIQKMAGICIDRVRQTKPIDKIVLDMDSSVCETSGQQEGTVYNGHFECTCYHPVFCFNQFGDLEQALLRNCNFHCAEDWRAVLEPVLASYRDQDLARYFRGDAAFAKPDLYEFLDAEGYGYAIRLPANDALEEKIRHLLTRPVGRPPKKPIVLYDCFLYRAASWNKWRRVVAKVEWHEGEIFPRVGFIVTGLWIAEDRVVRFYKGRGAAEQWIKEGKQAIKWTRLSCQPRPRFALDEPRLHREPSPPAVVRSGVQLGDLRSSACLATEHSAMVADDTAGEACQDRRQGCPTRRLHHVPVGRGSRAETAVRADLDQDRTTTGARRSGSVLSVEKWGTQAFIRTTAAVAVRPKKQKRTDLTRRGGHSDRKRRQTEPDGGRKTMERPKNSRYYLANDDSREPSGKCLTRALEQPNWLLKQKDRL